MVEDSSSPPAALPPRSQLPVPATPFVGREDELAALEHLLSDPQARLVTLVGPGGIGKTRLAIEAARRQMDRFAQRVFFVPLVALSTPADLLHAVAEALGFQFEGAGPNALTDQPGSPQQQLLDYFRQKHLLLILDSFEHLLDGADLLTTILQAAPGVHLLVTSRERLNQSGETLFTLGGMAFPGLESLEEALHCDAVQLFAQSARRVRRDFVLHAHDLREMALIYHLVGGLPLGLVLAAGMVDAFSLEQIAQELGRGLDFLATELRDIPDRHRSMRAVFDSAWNQLSEVERASFIRLSIFSGGFTAEAAQAVTGADLRQLSRLVNKSLLQRNLSTQRYSMHELLRQYAEDKLEHAGDVTAARDRHCAYFAEFAREHTAEFWGDPVYVGGVELANLRAAWNWGLEHQRVSDLRYLWIALFTINVIYGLDQQTYEMFASAPDLLRSAEPSADRDRVLGISLAMKGIMAGWFGRQEEMRELLPAGLAILRANDWSIERVWAEIGTLHSSEPGDFVGMRRVLEACLAYCRAEGAQETAIIVQVVLARLASSEGDFTQAEALLRACVDDREAVIPTARVFSLTLLAEQVLLREKWEEAELYYAEALVMSRAHRLWVYELLAFSFQVYYALHYDDVSRAEQLARQTLALAEDVGSAPAIRWYRDSLGDVKYAQGAYAEAGQIFEQNLADAQASGAQVDAGLAHRKLGFCWLALGKPERARYHLGQSLGAPSASRLELRRPQFQLTKEGALVGFAVLAAQEGDLEHALRLLCATSCLPEILKMPVVKEEARLRASLEAELGPDVVTAAIERSRQRNPQEVLSESMAEVQAQVTSLLPAGQPPLPTQQPSLYSLTDRELEVLRLLAEGYTNREIAARLFVGVSTVKKHINHIFDKLGVKNRTQAVALARSRHILG